ncbi:hypothetical protein Lesp02_02830 [Lentzea sp. NBRC 105346]|uniref:phosphotransferase n=1 Tax=Lentzea sp. NBRC 105346 TaxID=3032205 RepID=UPI0024A3A074|nr:phosphotransferase [Lentzea sp. NBRC 105346]GLZ28093.1 hypothetical protein Lesp02_02830 [Lentzea sp. NBRC 105346]
MSAAQPGKPRSFVIFDTSTNRHDDVLEHVERAFDLTLDRSSVVHGVGGVTEGFRTSRGTWARIEQRVPWRIKSAAWVGLEAASTIENVPMPSWYQSTTWIDTHRGLVWRADEVEFVASPSVKAAGGLEAAKDLPSTWWTGMRSSLKELGGHQTERVGVSQDHLTLRIGQVFENVDTTVDEWRTAHADLHWANVTVSGQLIDWEDWGLAPRGHDAATLWQASLPDSDLLARVEAEFADDLQTRSGKLSQLMHCANAIRIAAQRGTTTPFLEPATAEAEKLLADLRN